MSCKYAKNTQKTRQVCYSKTCGKYYSLKEVGIVLETEEGNCVGQHPYVAAPAVVVRLAPLAVLIPHAEDLVRDPLRVGGLIVSVSVVACNIEPAVL
jgi:hypothetical protein